MKKNLKHSMFFLALSMAAASASATDGDAVKYSLGGGLERTPIVSSYDTSYLFDFDEQNGEWSRTVTVGLTGNNYFSIFDSTGKKWSYSILAVDGDHAAEPLGPAYGNMEFTPKGVFPGVKLTISEEAGIPVLTISGFSQDVPVKTAWSVGGTAVSSMTYKGMIDAGNSIFIYQIPDVNTDATLHIIGPGAAGEESPYGFGGDPISAGISYLLTEGGADMKFDADYRNVAISWNAESKRMSFAGEPIWPGVGTLNPSSTSPASGRELTLTSPLTTVSFVFNQSENGIDKIKRQEGVSLKLMRDGVICREIPTTDINAIRLNRNNPNQLDINFDPVSEGGSYSLTLPRDFIQLSTMAGGTLDPDESEGDSSATLSYEKLRNATYTLRFSIKNMIPFTISVTPGEVETADLRQIKITYPDGAQVKTNPSFNPAVSTPAIYYIDETVIPGEVEGEERSTKVSGYSVSMDGNEVTLTALNPAAISDKADNANVRYYSVVVPAGAWIIEHDGISEIAPALSYAGFTIKKKVAENTDEVTISPSASAALPGEKMQTLSVTYPEGHSFNAWAAANPMGKRVGYVVGYLRKVTSATATEGEAAGDYKLSAIDTDSRTLTLEFTGDATNLSDGLYCIMLTNNLFILPDKSKNANIYFAGYQIDNNSTGIENLNPESTEFDIYDLNGVRIRANARNLTGLPAGIYVINGRKVMNAGK